MAAVAPTKKYIVTGMDWGVGITDVDVKESEEYSNIVLATEQIIGCVALFFVSNKSRWICHVGDTWNNKEMLLDVGITKENQLEEHLNNAAADFIKRTGGVPIEKIYICKNKSDKDLSGMILPDRITKWAKEKMSTAKLINMPEMSGAWCLDNSLIPKPWLSSANDKANGLILINYIGCGGDYTPFSIFSHRDVMLIPGAWSNPFIPSPSLLSVPEYEEIIELEKSRKMPFPPEQPPPLPEYPSSVVNVKPTAESIAPAAAIAKAATALHAPPSFTAGSGGVQPVPSPLLSASQSPATVGGGGQLSHPPPIPVPPPHASAISNSTGSFLISPAAKAVAMAAAPTDPMSTVTKPSNGAAAAQDSASKPPLHASGSDPSKSHP